MDRTPLGLPHQLWARHAGHVTAATSTSCATTDALLAALADSTRAAQAGSGSAGEVLDIHRRP